METHLARVQNPTTHFSQHNTEFSGEAPQDAASTEQAVENAILTIREILTEERRKTRRHALPDLAPHVPDEHLEPVKSKLSRRRIALWSRVKALHSQSFTLNFRHAGWLVVFALVLWQPLPVLIAMFIGFWMVLFSYAIFGAQRMKQLRSQLLHRIPRSFSLRRAIPELWLRREPEPDIYLNRPDPFDRIAVKAR